MQDVVAQAQAAANQYKTTMYVFVGRNINGHEAGWFNDKGFSDKPNDELYCKVEPEAGQSPS